MTYTYILYKEPFELMQFSNLLQFKGHWQRKFLFAFSIALRYLTVKILLFPAQTA